MYSSLTQPAPIEHLHRSVRYNTTLGECLDTVNNAETPSMHRLFAGAGIVRGLIDYKIEAPEELVPENIPTTIHEASDALFGDVSAYEKLMDGLSRCADFAVVGELDSTSYSATLEADYTEASAKVHELQPDKSKLIIGVAHGGLIAARLVLAGLQVFHDDTESVMYPIRYSSDKRGDCRPQISDVEADYISDLGRDRMIVVVDDDCFSRTTISGMTRTMQNRSLSHGNAVEWMVMRTGQGVKLLTSAEERQFALVQDPYPSI